MKVRLTTRPLFTAWVIPRYSSRENCVPAILGSTGLTCDRHAGQGMSARCVAGAQAPRIWGGWGGCQRDW